MIVEQLNIYPIKGLGGIKLESAKALERGFENDRRFMLVDLEGNFLSQRGLPEMALFSQKIIGDQLQIQYNQENINLSLSQKDGNTMDTIVWGDPVENAIQVGKEANEWFSDQLGQACVLLKMNEATIRSKGLSKEPNNTQVSFADGYPYLVLGTASLAHLNTKLEEQIKMDRFRANIIVRTNIAHEEDELDQCNINGLKFRMIKPCARCQVTTINQQNASISKEPLKTLASYRKKNNKVNFGMNMVCLDEGMIKVGDQLLGE